MADNRSGWKTQVLRQIGEHLVVVELGRQLELLATPFAGNVPAFDLIAVDKRGRALPIQVKTIASGDWQSNDITKFLDVKIVDTNGDKEEQHYRGMYVMPEVIWVFVWLDANRTAEFFVMRLRDVQENLARYFGGQHMIRRKKGVRHCTIKRKDIERFRDNWNIVLESLGGNS